MRDDTSDNEKLGNLNGSITSNDEAKSAYEDQTPPTSAVINSGKMR
jgi:hypothetical protein